MKTKAIFEGVMLGFCLALLVSFNPIGELSAWASPGEGDWEPRGPVESWQSVAMSSDGKIQTAVEYDYYSGQSNGQIYVSTDYGDTWAQKTTEGKWSSVAMSSDGLRQTAVEYGGQIYVSTDYGDTWTPKGSGGLWISIAMTSDGKIQTVVDRVGQIYVSTDYGNTWTPKGPSKYWWSVALSSDGSLQTALGENTQIYISTDYGDTWAPKEIQRTWKSIAMSSDGKIQTAVEIDGQIYISTDYGDTWTSKGNRRKWYSIAISSDGKIQTAVVKGGQIYISTDYGSTWMPQENNRGWSSVAMSSDGVRQTAVVNNGQIYVLQSLKYLSVSLSADPNPGTVLDQFSLTADVSGTAQGLMNYTFYCNRSDDGKDITPDYDARFENVSETTKTVENLCSYSDPGTYTAKVIVERDGLAAEDRVPISVTYPHTDVNGDGCVDINDLVLVGQDFGWCHQQQSSNTCQGESSCGYESLERCD